MRRRAVHCLFVLSVSCGAAQPSGDTAVVRVRVTVRDEPGAVVVAQPDEPARLVAARAPATPRRSPPVAASPVCGVEAPDARMPAFDEVSLGHGHTCARLQDGTVRCWGWNLDGQTGDGHTGSDGGPRAPAQVVDVEAATQMCAGFSYTCALHADGTSECWGNNTHNQIRFSLGASCTAHPVRSPVDHLRALSCGGWHVCAIRVDGSAWCWGEDAPRYSPWRVAIRERVAEVASGWHRSCARTAANRVFCWTTSAREPVEVLGFASPPAQLAVAEHHACARSTEGSLCCWGANAYGQLGNNRTASPDRAEAPTTVVW